MPENKKEPSNAPSPAEMEIEKAKAEDRELEDTEYWPDEEHDLKTQTENLDTEHLSPPREDAGVHQQDSRREPYILEQLEEAKRHTQKTGQRSTVKIDKKKFIQEVPHAGREPRMAFTPKRFNFSYGRYETLTVGELREICLAAKGHPFAIQRAMQVEGQRDERVVHLFHEHVNFLRQLSS